MKHLLTIAGSDCSGGAGIQADLKTFAAHKVYGMSVITGVTAQNTTGVFAVELIKESVIRSQIEAVFDDIAVDGVKIGMLGSAGIIQVVAECLKKYKPPYIVLDPVMVAKGGQPLLQPEAVEILKQELLPLATVVTPNIPEGEIIAGRVIHNREDMEKAARIIMGMAAGSVLLKGGHGSEGADDLLLDAANGRGMWLTATRVNTPHTHGTGCSLSSAIAANLAQGMPLDKAVAGAKRYVLLGIEHGLAVGHGHGPIHHFVEMWKG